MGMVIAPFNVPRCHSSGWRTSRMMASLSSTHDSQSLAGTSSIEAGGGVTDPMVRPVGTKYPGSTHAPLDTAEGMIDIAVLASGSGTNLRALLDRPDVRARIRLVASDRDDARALERASSAGIETTVVRWHDHPGRDAFSTALADAVEDRGCKGVVLAGFMRILAPSFVDRFPGRILNIHPSLLPAFPGAHAVESALKHGVKVTGVTVHIVDEQVDHGPIIAQRAVPVEPDDTIDSLHARIQVEEHRLYPEIVSAFIRGEIDELGRLTGGGA